MGFQSDVLKAVGSVEGALAAKSIKDIGTNTKEIKNKLNIEIPAFTEEEKKEMTPEKGDELKESQRYDQNMVGPMPSEAWLKNQKAARAIMLEENQGIGTLPDSEIEAIVNEYDENYGSGQSARDLHERPEYKPYDIDKMKKYTAETYKQVEARNTQQNELIKRKNDLKNKRLTDITGLAYNNTNLNSSFRGNASQSGVSKDRVIQNIQEPYVKGGTR